MRIAEAAGARVIRLPQNMGFARAVNEGIRANGYDWIAVLNNDVAPRADWLERLLAAAQPDPYWFAASKLLDANDPERLDGCYDEISRGGCAWHCGQGRKDGGLWDQPRRIRFAPFTAALFRAGLFDSVGLLDEEFESYLEDVDFGIRCALRGYSGVYAPDAVAAHEGSATLGKWHPDTVRRISRNQLRLVTKHYPRNWIWRYGWCVLIGQTLWGLLATRHGCGWAFCRGKMRRAGGFVAPRRAGVIEPGPGHLLTPASVKFTGCKSVGPGCVLEVLLCSDTGGAAMSQVTVIVVITIRVVILNAALKAAARCL